MQLYSPYFYTTPVVVPTIDPNNSGQIIQRNTFRNRLIQSFIDFVVIGIVFAAFAIVYAKLDPTIRYFHCSDTDIFFPKKKDTIPFYAVGLYGTIGPILLIFIVELINARLLPCQSKKEGSRWKRFGTSSLHAISLFVLGIGTTLLLTEIGKRWIGRLRPHFIDVCNPNLDAIQCLRTNTNVIYNTIDTSGSFCRGNADDIKEARLSFPSGHSSYSTYTMLFLILYIQARLILYKFRFVKPLIQLTAFIAAYVTCISRIGDYHHRGSDVIGGIVLGAIIAFFITLVLGRVLWRYSVETDYHDFDLKPVKTI